MLSKTGRGKPKTLPSRLTSRRPQLISGAPKRRAPVAELADAHGSGPCSERSGGSTPLGRTILSRGSAIGSSVARSGTSCAPTRAMYWRRSIALRRFAFAAPGNCRSSLARTMPTDRAERTERFCKGCGADTPHDNYDDTGYGRYAQMWRCRHCGGESVNVWPIGYSRRL